MIRVLQKREFSDKQPLISVIITSYGAEKTLERCLEALSPQVVEDVEVILVDSSPHDACLRISTRFSWLTVIHSNKRLYCGGGRNLAIQHASGSIFAFTDADCLVAPNWIESLRIAHVHPALVIGGAIGNANPESWVGWGYYFGEFSHWMAGLPERESVIEVPGCNLSIKREAWDRFGPFIEEGYGSDSHFCWQARQAGLSIRFDPRFCVNHINPTQIKGNLRHEVMHGQRFGQVRRGWWQNTPVRRWLYALGSPLLPPLLLSRIAANVHRSRWSRAKFVTALPLVFATVLAWSWGETRAYWSR